MENDTENFKSVFILSFGPSATEKQWSKRTQKRRETPGDLGRQTTEGGKEIKKKYIRTSATTNCANERTQRRGAAPLARGPGGGGGG